MNGKECEASLLERDKTEVDEILVIFSDINMPEMDGFELLEKIKEKYAYLSVVMVSAYDDIATMERVKKMGAITLLPKPVDFKRLKKILLDINSESHKKESEIKYTG